MDVSQSIEERLKEMMERNNQQLLGDIGQMIHKISDNSLKSNSCNLLEAPKFKRKSNEEQYKANDKVMHKLIDIDSALDLQDLSAAKEAIIEGKI
ncbi:hypothetical protein ACF0H5_008689 [Mactra antiquata]